MGVVAKQCLNDVFKVIADHEYPDDLTAPDDQLLIGTSDIYQALEGKWSQSQIDRALNYLVKFEKIAELSPKRWDLLVTDEELNVIARRGVFEW